MLKGKKIAYQTVLIVFILFLGCKKDSPSSETPTPELTGEGDFAIVFMPDTQSYIAWKEEIFKAQTQWLANNKTALNILFVAHEGDVVMNAGEDKEWEIVLDGFADLDNAAINYAVAPGNHDYLKSTRESGIFNQHFPLEKFKKMPTYGGAFEEGKSDNTYHLIKTPKVEIALLMLEFGPRNAVIDWANTVISEHPNHLFIVVTHAYLNEKDELLGASTPKSATSGYGLGNDANNGVDMWTKLIKNHSNISFVFSGHTGNKSDGAGLLISESDAGNSVYQIMANYQYWQPLNSSGQLRMLQFDVDNEQILMTTYSPWLDASHTDASSNMLINDLKFVK
jgi:hypothetical protein